MKEISVCRGMSCTINNSSDVIDKINSYLEEKDIKDFYVTDSRCKSYCSQGVIVRIDGKIYKNVNEDNIEYILDESIK